MMHWPEHEEASKDDSNDDLINKILKLPSNTSETNNIYSLYMMKEEMKGWKNEKPSR